MGLLHKWPRPFWAQPGPGRSPGPKSPLLALVQGLSWARVPWSKVQGDLESSAIIRCAEKTHRELFPKPLVDRGRAGAAVLAGITNITCTPLDMLRSRPHHAVHSHTSLPACPPAQQLWEHIPDVYMLKIHGYMRHRPQTPKYLIVLANEASQYLSAQNLQVPLIFPSVWCLVLTGGKRVVNRRAHLQF